MGSGAKARGSVSLSKQVEKQDFPFKTKMMGLLVSLLLRFLFYTSRKRYVDLHKLTRFFEKSQPIIVVSWHNRNILSSMGYLVHRPKGRQFFPMASASKDGTIATVTMKWMGVTCIRGSSSRGGTQALRAMIRMARAGCDLGITPDGPRGPAYRIQEGVITTARLAGLPIVPIAYQAKRKKILNSWDRMILPYPFNTLNYVYGDAITVPKDCSEEGLEKYRLEVEQELMRVCEVSELF